MEASEVAAIPLTSLASAETAEAPGIAELRRQLSERVEALFLGLKAFSHQGRGRLPLLVPSPAEACSPTPGVLDSLHRIVREMEASSEHRIPGW